MGGTKEMEEMEGREGMEGMERRYTRAAMRYDVWAVSAMRGWTRRRCILRQRCMRRSPQLERRVRGRVWVEEGEGEEAVEAGEVEEEGEGGSRRRWSFETAGVLVPLEDLLRCST